MIAAADEGGNLQIMNYIQKIHEKSARRHSLSPRLASLDATRQPGGSFFSRQARAPHPRRRAALRLRRRRVPGFSSRARYLARDMAPSSPPLLSLYLPPTPQNPVGDARRARGWEYSASAARRTRPHSARPIPNRPKVSRSRDGPRGPTSREKGEKDDAHPQTLAARGVYRAPLAESPACAPSSPAKYAPSC